MRRVLLLLVVLGLGASTVGMHGPARAVAITFDDLPGVSALHGDAAFFDRVNRELIASLRRHRVPAIGFVNESKLAYSGAVEPARVALLQLWLDAGLELGNHTYSHLDLHSAHVEDYTRDILRGEAVTRPLMTAAGQTLRFFRHPYLRTGRDAATRSRVDGFLQSRGYTVAPVTIDNFDYTFAAAYDRAVAAGDTTRAARVVEAYVDYMARVTAYYEQQAHAIVGRELPQILLLHVNALNARAFDALAAMLTGRGYAFVPLAQALGDAAYSSPDEFFGPGGISWLHRWALTAGTRGAFFAGEPELPDWIVSAAKR